MLTSQYHQIQQIENESTSYIIHMLASHGPWDFQMSPPRLYLDFCIKIDIAKENIDKLRWYLWDGLKKLNLKVLIFAHSLFCISTKHMLPILAFNLNMWCVTVITEECASTKKSTKFCSLTCWAEVQEYLCTKWKTITSWRCTCVAPLLKLSQIIGKSKNNINSCKNV